MSPEKIYAWACRAQPNDPPIIVTARNALRAMPAGPERHRGAILITSWELAQPNDISANVAPRRPSAQAEPLELCSYCGRPSAVLHSDHIVAKARGGDEGLHNRTPACKQCNDRKTDKPFLIWLMEIGDGP